MKKFLDTITNNNIKMLRKPMLVAVAKAMLQGQPFFVILMVMLELLKPLMNPGASVDLPRLAFLCAWLLLSLVLLYLAGLGAYTSEAGAAYSASSEGRLGLGDHLRKLSMGFFRGRDPGDITALMLTDYSNIETMISHLLMDAISSVVLPVVFLVFLLPFNWRMTLITMAPIPLALMAAVLTRLIVLRTGKRHIKAKNDATSRMLEYLDGMKNIKAFNLHGAKFERLRKSFDTLKRISIRQEAAAGPAVMLGVWILNAGIALIMLLGIAFLLRGTLSLPHFLFFLILGTRMYDPLSRVLVNFVELSYFSISAARIKAIFDTRPLPEPEQATKLSRHDIHFDNVTFHYHETDVLKNVSFSLQENTMTALVGHSGSGKSTITRLIARFWDVNDGEVRIGGRPVAEYRSEDLLAKISMVFQDVYLFNDTILNNIKVGRADATMVEVIAAAQKAQCHEFIEKLSDGYETMVGERGATLSGGEKQRISIARAILKDAPIVLLDEATASLDPENELYIQEAIGELIKGRTLVVIAHRLSTITHADQILVLKRGEIVERGTHDELLSNGEGTYAAMWNEQKHAHNWKLKATAEAGLPGERT
jgi:ATP-binding cassette subfamily B protein